MTNQYSALPKLATTSASYSSHSSQPHVKEEGREIAIQMKENVTTPKPSTCSDQQKPLVLFEVVSGNVQNEFICQQYHRPSRQKLL